MTQVVIVGAGPAGLTTALVLARSGCFTPIVLEARSEDWIRNRHRAGLLEARTVQALWHLGVAGRMLEHDHQHRRCEFRIDGRPIMVELARHSGASQWVWPQHELIADLLKACRAAGVVLRFEVTDIGFDDLTAGTPMVHYLVDGERRWELCTAVVGADGWQGITRGVLAKFTTTEQAPRHQNYAWLALLVACPPTWDRIVYGVHRRGFAGHMLRSDTITRYYLEVPRHTDPETITDDWIFSELNARLEAEVGRGPILERAVVEMDSTIVTPMHLPHGRLFLAGDAAHILPPVGAKGLNLAVADAVDLAGRLIKWGTGDRLALDSYTTDRLVDVCRVETFSARLGALLHRTDDDSRAALRRMLTDPDERTQFCHAYVGTPKGLVLR